MAKPNVRKQITEAKVALREVMATQLMGIKDSMVEQIISKLHRLPESKRFEAINGIEPRGVRSFSDALLSSLAVVAYESLKQARLEVPKKAKTKLADWNEQALRLGEWEKLPAGLRARLSKLNQLLVTTQLADLEKALYFQFGHSVDSTDSIDTIEADLNEAGEDYIDGNAIESGAGTVAAQTINESRVAFFFDDEVLEEIEAFEFVNGDPVSEVCTDLAGSIFDKNDQAAFRYQPPLHWNCKSYIVPILMGDLGNREITGLKPSTKKIEDTIQFTEHAHTMGRCVTCGA